MNRKKVTGSRTAVLALLMVIFLLSGCLGSASKNNDASGSAPSSAASSAMDATPSQSEAPKDVPYWEMLDKVQDTSELPDWKGPQLKLKVWYASGTGNLDRKTSEQDVVWPEIKRVTGIEFDKDASFDNGGQSFTNKMGMLAAANDWPDLIIMGQDTDFKQLVDAGKVYDLTDLYPQYEQSYMKRVPMDKLDDVYKQVNVNGGQDGKIYAVPGQIGPESLPLVYPDIDQSRLSNIAPPQEIDGWSSGALVVRDDILKKIFPNAKSLKEIQDLYMQNGKFTQDDVFDVPITSKEQFYQFLRDVKALNIKENGKPVEPTFIAGDSFALMTALNGILEGYTGFNTNWTYWDKQAQKVQYMFKQDWYKQDVKNLWQLVHDGTIPKESLVDNDAALTEKLANGQYAMTYAWYGVDNAQLEKEGKPYRYRPIHVNIMPDYNRFNVITGIPNSGNMIAVFKDSVKQENLEQVMRFLDFMVSDVGTKLIYWGPKSAGLWEEKDGKRIFKDKELEDSMVYGVQNGANLKYNLYNEWSATPVAWPAYPKYTWGGDYNHPKFTYDKVKNPGDALTFFQTGQVVKLQQTVGAAPDIWNFQGKVPAVDEWNKAKQVSEDAFRRIFAAKDDAQFEKLYGEYVAVNEKNGLNDATLDEINKVYSENVNKGYMDFKLKN